MALDWKKALKTVAQSTEFKNAKATSVTLTPAQRLGKSMDKALATFKAGNKDTKRPTIIQKGEEVKFTIRYANSPLKLIGNEKEAVVPAKEFEAVYLAIKESVLAGEFDTQLKTLSDGAKKRGAVGAKTRAAKK